ncbi:MAG: NUDIX domain-containing protein [Thaumarchaeota archaeon]|nr:NUDIX domain-containing protein [Nitrososphaerota archaeon]
MRSRREYPEHPLVGAGGLIHKDGAILLIKRKFEPNKGRWSLPGGLVEVGEDPAEAARREVREELGVEVEMEGLFQVANELIRDDAGKVRFHFVLIDYLMTLRSDRITLNEESEEYRWFNAGDVERLNTSDNTKNVARKFIEGEREQSLR